MFDYGDKEYFKISFKNMSNTMISYFYIKTIWKTKNYYGSNLLSLETNKYFD